ncbi:hypothetical protein CFY91_11680 [Pseudomonas fluvialis]|jgi:hypothetical protein|uniref:DUF1161 domain-containing protein n=1 Tax=Pseudomonas fluvialis TaxID=1793966 RepID=A0ABQ2AI40_9PSED|nr:DUF1161 domain-containing protein [Pseudomonas fluvialis]OXM40002.1 hypothetical protein CFY91_11680 [Pseudomonas fluvialis]GGH90613.1 hypothetical protein GCM10007363_08540 [Pseudomonas fluvialis]
MRALIIASSLCLLAGQALAAGKDCEELKAEIAAKLDAKGVTGYSLEIVAQGTVIGAQVVGRCEMGSKEILYVRQPF